MDHRGLRRLYPKRSEDSRKGDFGRVVIVGGSLRFSGAPAFNALAALRCGADLAVVVAPRRAADIVAGFSPDLITVPSTRPFPDPKLVADASRGANALVIGGGVERTPEAHAALRRIIRQTEVPMVLDAEALHAIRADPSILRGKKAVLTPHGGEFRVLSGAAWPARESARKEVIRTLARRFGATVIVKGRWDFISDGSKVVLDREGSPYLTKGGYGDLVAGAAGALLARKISPFLAAQGAAFIVGRAGARAARRNGESTAASDALAEIPAVIGP
ncbi:MAG: NAD(P)H-hydrate dehydratase [Thermoplasmatota archaeon]